MSEKVLVVEDDEILSGVSQRILTQEGYSALHAATIRQAMQVDRDERPQLGLIDLCLPDGDGIQLADALRAQRPGLPLIVVTAYPVRLRDNSEATKHFVRVRTKLLNVRELRQTLATSLSATPMTDKVLVATPPACAAAERPSSCLPLEMRAFRFFRV
jgi:DNA-binding NtrC family response regulator